MRYIYLLNIWCLFGLAAFAQPKKVTEKDSTKRIELKAVTVLGQKEAIQPFYYVQSFESANLPTTTLLNQSNHIYLNEQGPNLLTTGSIRGQSAQAVPVVWKNWTLNSVMNGIFDLSLANAYLLNKTRVIFSETVQSAGWGGAGASLQLDNSADFSAKELSYQYGSFGKQQIGVSIGFKKQSTFLGLTEISNQTKAIYHKANNNFLLNLPNNDTLKQENNALKEFGFINSTQLEFANLHKLNLDVWWQKTNREIPPTLVTLGLRKTQSHQLDSTLRVNLHWQHPNHKLKAGLAYFNELNQYIDPFLDVNNIHKVQSLKSFVRLNKAISANLSSYSTLNYQLSSASSTNLAKKHHFRNTIELKSHLIYRFPKIPLSVKADAVIELTDGKWLPFRPGFYINYSLNKKLHFKGQHSRHYRLPTFNDLFWQRSGNIELQPEEGWLTELHASYQIKNWKTNFSIFNNLINNEILWLPKGLLWKPDNYTKVRSRGFDANLKYECNLAAKVRMKINAAYTFVEAVKIESKRYNDESLFKQVIYKPKHKAVANAELNYQNFTFNWVYRYVSKRYTTADHSYFVAAYQLSDFTFSYLAPIHDLEMQLSATIFNIFNTPYEVITKRPMPGRHFLLTSNFKF